MDRATTHAAPKSRMPARLDLAQSVSGLILGLFMWTHLMLVSSILLGKDAMHFVSRAMELSFLSPAGEGYPIVVSLAGIGVSTLFVVHAGLAMRKFPANWKQASTFREHMAMMRHPDTSHWWRQVVTGFVMFFLGSVHLYVIITHPAEIGPYASSDRVWGFMWPLYLVLLFAVEVHAAIGMYRLAVKWGVFDGDDPRRTRRRLKVAEHAMTAFFLTLGVLSLLAYMKIGYEHREQAGQPYIPAASP